MRKAERSSIIPIIILATCTLCAAKQVRYFKAEHGVGATYLMLAPDGHYKVIDREHMGIFLTDEGHWQQSGDVVSFGPTNPRNPPYQAREVRYKGHAFLAITSSDAAAGIVIDAEDTKRDLDTEPKNLPDHVLFKITARTYSTETKQTYPFRYLGNQAIENNCESLKSASQRPEDNQPIPKQLKIPNAPKTAREVSCFESLNKNSTMHNVVTKCGVPDKHLGSGVYIFSYYMNDCSVVSVSTPDLQRLVMKHVKDGNTTTILSNW